MIADLLNNCISILVSKQYQHNIYYCTSRTIDAQKASVMKSKIQFKYNQFSVDELMMVNDVDVEAIENDYEF